MNARIFELRDQISKAQDEIDALQKTCPHPTYHVMMFMWRVGAFNPSRICDECGLSIAGITPEESEKCWNEWNAQYPMTVTMETVVDEQT